MRLRQVARFCFALVLIFGLVGVSLRFFLAMWPAQEAQIRAELCRTSAFMQDTL